MSINQLPNTLAIGGGVTQQIPQWLSSRNLTLVLLITDSTMMALGYGKKIQSMLQASALECDVFDETVPEPTAESIQKGVKAIKLKAYDAIIALGGGSVIDSAKAIAVMSTHPGTIRDVAFPTMNDEPSIPIIAVPTTAGTGSEVTRFTIITDETTDEKLLCVGNAFVPTAAFIDYELSLSVPPRSTADTGIDAITHAIEAYVSQKANLYSDSQALAAMRLLGPNITTAYHSGNDHQARAAMMLGSTLAGIAFSSASVALVHGMSRPIGAFFHVPHGLSNAMLLPSITAFSLPHALNRYAECAVALGYADSKDTAAVAANKLVDRLIELNAELQVPTLSDFGIDQTRYMAAIPIMAQQALASGSPQNNPYVPTKAEIESLYVNLWD